MHGANEEAASHGEHGMPTAMAGDVDAASSHHGSASHAADGEEADECDGACGLCCSTVDQVAATLPAVWPLALHDAVNVGVARPHAVVLPARAAFFLPFANGPPGSSPLLS